MPTGQIVKLTDSTITVEWLVAHGVERLEDQQAEPEQSNAHHPTL